MDVLGKIKENFGGAAAGAMMFGLALTPQFATQAHADEVKLAAVNTNAASIKNSAPQVILRYGSKIDVSDIKITAEVMTERGVTTEARSGFEKENCVSMSIQGKEIGWYTADEIIGDMPSVAERHLAGKKIKTRHLGDCGFDPT